jgi:hypothetical protein
MSGTQYLSPLLQDPAWQALSRQLSVEARIAIFYLDELWKDERFQRDWTRLKEAYFEAQREAIAVLRELHRKDFRTLSNAERKRAEALFLRGANEHACCLVEQLKEYVPDLIRDATWNYLFRRAYGYQNPEAEDEDSNRRKIYAISTGNIYAILDPENFHLAEWELVRSFFSGELGELRLDIYFYDREYRAVKSSVAFSETPFFVLKACVPLPSESKQDYLKRITRDLKHELKLLAEPCSHRQPEILPRFLNELKQLGYEFHNPRNAIPAILALAEDYYEKCAAEQCLQVSNLNDETLARYATAGVPARREGHKALETDSRSRHARG